MYCKTRGTCHDAIQGCLIEVKGVIDHLSATWSYLLFVFPPSVSQLPSNLISQSACPGTRRHFAAGGVRAASTTSPPLEPWKCSTSRKGECDSQRAYFIRRNHVVVTHSQTLILLYNFSSLSVCVCVWAPLQASLSLSLPLYASVLQRLLQWMERVSRVYPFKQGVLLRRESHIRLGHLLHAAARPEHHLLQRGRLLHRGKHRFVITISSSSVPWGFCITFHQHWTVAYCFPPNKHL